MTEARMKKIAGTTGFLAVARIPSGRTLHEHLHSAPSEERKFIESQLCRFDTSIFSEMHEDINRILNFPSCKSRYLAY